MRISVWRLASLTSRLVGQKAWGHRRLASFFNVRFSTQQAKRLQHPLWILYIDLATMFPKVRRDLASIAEALTGLPPDVIRLTELIYGAHRDRDGAVQCQYDTAAGLGKPFANHMGRRRAPRSCSTRS